MYVTLYGGHTQRGDFEVVVVASDRGTPPLSSEVLVQMSIVDRANRPPVWDQRVYGPITIPENISVGQTVYSVKARFVDTRGGPSARYCAKHYR